MKIESGLLDHAVIQRGKDGTSDAAFSGTAETDGEVTVTVKRGSRLVSRCNGIVKNGRLSGRFEGAPAGGPYDVELVIKDANGDVADKAVVKEVYVGDVWLAAGQSNMEGVGILKQACKSIAGVQAMYQDDRWAVAMDPIHDRAIAMDSVFNGGKRTGPTPDRSVGVGPAVAFAQAMHKSTGVPQGVIACALGATSMRQWDPALLEKGGASLYGAMIRRLNLAGGRVAGMIWYQGESDALEKAQDIYPQKMTEFVAAVRRDAGDEKLPIVMTQIGRVVGWGSAPEWNAVQEHQRLLGETVPGLAVVAVADLGLEDTIHLSSAAQHRLGARMAYAMEVLKRGRSAGKPPMKLQSVHLERNHPAFEQVEVVFSFANVVGSLTSGGTRAAGFCVGDPEPAQGVLDILLEGSKVRVITKFTWTEIGTRKIYHGHGTDAFVNITDHADRALPVMAGMPLASMARK